jgi:RHS repeat-associated protein
MFRFLAILALLLMTFTSEGSLPRQAALSISPQGAGLPRHSEATAGGIGGLLARTDHASSSTYFYHADGAGNVTTLSDGQGRIAARYLYNPFGRLIAKWGPMADVNRYQFSSKESDYLSGLSYYGYRFYDPTLQRWLTRDPLGETGGINLYGFVGNDPLDQTDPLGLRYGNPVSGPTGPVGPSGSFDSGFGNYPNGVNFPPYPFFRKPMFPKPTEPPPHAEMEWNQYTGEWDDASGIQTDDELFMLMLPLKVKGFKGKPCPPSPLPMAGRKLGHTFTKHGMENTNQLLKEAEATGKPVGQWLDDAAAEEFIASHIDELKNGAKTFDLPEGLGRMVNPDGSFSAATKARLVPSGSGVKTAYPITE